MDRVWGERSTVRQSIVVRVLTRGFESEGEVYRFHADLAHAVARAHSNGCLFFGIQAPKPAWAR
ncbi:MAG: DUF2924 domain-containing protein [Leptolyngbya sp. PLA1]|nr:DUF2924 domain-containing protein [Leptolyngbya sp. PLA1]